MTFGYFGVWAVFFVNVDQVSNFIVFFTHPAKVQSHFSIKTRPVKHKTEKSSEQVGCRSGSKPVKNRENCDFMSPNKGSSTNQCFTHPCPNH